MKYLVRQHFTSEGIAPAHIRRQIADAIRANTGKNLVLTLQVAKKYSSDPQRQYYFAVIVEQIAAMFQHFTGYYWDKEETHEWLMENVGEYFEIRNDIKGKPRRIRRSYKDLSTIEAEEYHMKCRAFAAQYQVDILEPNEVPCENYERTETMRKAAV